MLRTALLFARSLSSPPWGLSRSMRAISTRMPMPGGTTNGMTIGTDGATTTYVPIRTALEVQQWGATRVAWTYADRAVRFGYASVAQYVGELTAMGVQVQATTNTSAVNETTGPFAEDLAGNLYSANNQPLRPALASGVSQSPTYARSRNAITFAPAGDAATTWPAKAAAVAAQLAAGCTAVQVDDPRGTATFCGFAAHRPDYDLISQAADYSPSAIAGFREWLGNHTTETQRLACGLPLDLTGFDYKDFLLTQYAALVKNGPGGSLQANPSLPDIYLFRTQVPSVEQLRTHQALFARYHRQAAADFLSFMRAQAGVPMSINFYAASPMDYQLWIGRLQPQTVDFAISEVPPPYYSQISAYTPGSASFHRARWAQCGRQFLQMAMTRYCGLLAMCEHKPTAPNQAPPRLVRQIMRQSCLQTIMEGHIPLPPVDVYLADGGLRDQGVDVDGYRWWGAVADYRDIFDFLAANAAVIDDYETLAVTHLVCHSGSFPYDDGGSIARFDELSRRAGELYRRDVPYHVMVVGNNEGSAPEPPDPVVAAAAPVIIRLQDDGDYAAQLPSVSGTNYRAWSTAAADEAMAVSPVRSMSDSVRAVARYNPVARRVSVHLQNYAVNADGTPRTQTTCIRWNLAFGAPAPGVAAVVRLGEAPGTVDLSRGVAQITLREYAILNFAVA